MFQLILIVLIGCVQKCPYVTFSRSTLIGQNGTESQRRMAPTRSCVLQRHDGKWHYCANSCQSQNFFFNDLQWNDLADVLDCVGVSPRQRQTVFVGWCKIWFISTVHFQFNLDIVSVWVKSPRSFNLQPFLAWLYTDLSQRRNWDRLPKSNHLQKKHIFAWQLLLWLVSWVGCRCSHTLNVFFSPPSAVSVPLVFRPSVISAILNSNEPRFYHRKFFLMHVPRRRSCDIRTSGRVSGPMFCFFKPPPLPLLKG